MNNMDIELAVILNAIRDSAIEFGVCLKLNGRLNVGSCHGLKCAICPLFQGRSKIHYFDKWASVASPLTIEVKNE